MHVGAGLWALRSTAAHPTTMPELYARAIDDARRVERLGFDSFWLAEHRFWYDGWCPQPLVLAAAIAAATERFAVGTAMHLLGQHEPQRSVAQAHTLEQLYPGRIHLGVSLGYRPEEFDGLGIRMRDRAPLFERGLDALAGLDPGPQVWVGGMAEAAIVRAATRGLSLLLPPTLTPAQLRKIVSLAKDTAEQHGVVPGRIGMLKDVWIGDENEGAARLRDHYIEYVTAWWGRNASGGVDRDRIAAQLDRNVAAAAVGRPEQVLESLSGCIAEGVDLLVLQMHMESTLDVDAEQFALAAEFVLPALGSERA